MRKTQIKLQLNLYLLVILIWLNITLNESSYTLKVIGKDGKIAAGQEVTFNINGVFYHRVSDDNGVVSLGIKLRPAPTL